MATNVVVEIRIDVGATPLLQREPPGPVAKPRIGIATTVGSARPVKAHIHEWADPFAACRGPSHVVDAECHPEPFEHSHHVVRVPTRIAELQDMAKAVRQYLQEVLQPLTVELPSRRKLKEHGTKVTAKRVHTSEQPVEGFLGIFQLLHVRQKPAGLHTVEKTARR